MVYAVYGIVGKRLKNEIDQYVGIYKYVLG